MGDVKTDNLYRCPACGFQIFNRRVKKCEFCHVELPAALLFTVEEMAAMDIRRKKIYAVYLAQKRAEEMKSNSFSDSYSGYADSGDGGSGGFDGGGDCS